MVRKIFLLSFLVLFLLPNLAQAAGLVPCGGSGEDTCTFCHFFVLFNNILKFLMFRIVPVLAVLMLALAGLMFMVAHFGGGPALLGQAKKAITSVVIGLAIIFCAWIAVDTILVKSGLVKSELDGLTWTWWKITCKGVSFGPAEPEEPEEVTPPPAPPGVPGPTEPTEPTEPPPAPPGGPPSLPEF